MKLSMKEVLCRAIVKIATPLASILLRNGISYGLFSEMTKRAFVDAAADLQVADNKRVTVTNSAVMTGLTRKEVKRINEEPADSLHQVDDKYNRAVRVISGWINSEAYCDRSGAPLSIPFNGDSVSFSALVKQFSGDMGSRAMLAILKDAGCVLVTDEAEDEQVTLIKHAYVPQQSDETSINILGTDTAELISTIEHNLGVQSNEDKWYQRKVSNHQLDRKHLEEFKALAFSRSQRLLEDLDQWLTGHETDEPDDQHYVSLGIFYHEKPESVDAQKRQNED